MRALRVIYHSLAWDASPEVENTAAHNARGQLASEPAAMFHDTAARTYRIADAGRS